MLQKQHCTLVSFLVPMILTGASFTSLISPDICGDDGGDVDTSGGGGGGGADGVRVEIGF